MTDIAHITVDGINYRVEFESDLFISVYHAEGDKAMIASAMYDPLCEAVEFSYYEDGQRIADGSLPSLYDEPASAIARWLAATHPLNG